MILGFGTTDVTLGKSPPAAMLDITFSRTCGTSDDGNADGRLVKISPGRNGNKREGVTSPLDRLGRMFPRRSSIISGFVELGDRVDGTKVGEESASRPSALKTPPRMFSG